MGGQEGDQGTIQTDTGIVRVDTTIKAIGDKIGHVGMAAGRHGNGRPQKAKMVVDADTRMRRPAIIARTHLLQKALRDVLGAHVEQAGSYVSADRLRFDFTHFQAMTPQELSRVEREVNRHILAALPVKTEQMTMEEARKSGAMALFGEKYGSTVRVVSMGDYSKELCGGTHLSNTAQAGSFKILSESGVAAGVRRIEALTGLAALEHYNQQEEALKEVAGILKTNQDRVVEAASTLTQHGKRSAARGGVAAESDGQRRGRRTASDG